MHKYRRDCNKNLLKALIKYNGLTLETLGRKCDPPVSKVAIWKVLNGKLSPERLLIQISDIFHIPHLILFPFVRVQDSQPENQRKSTDVEGS